MENTVYRAVGSTTSIAGRYQHSACNYTEMVDKGEIFGLCENQSCPNKGANWILQEIPSFVAIKE
jgi:hypothetical protein